MYTNKSAIHSSTLLVVEHPAGSETARAFWGFTFATRRVPRNFQYKMLMCASWKCRFSPGLKINVVVTKPCKYHTQRPLNQLSQTRSRLMAQWSLSSTLQPPLPAAPPPPRPGLAWQVQVSFNISHLTPTPGVDTLRKERKTRIRTVVEPWVMNQEHCNQLINLFRG